MKKIGFIISILIILGIALPAFAQTSYNDGTDYTAYNPYSCVMPTSLEIYSQSSPSERATLQQQTADDISTLQLELSNQLSQAQEQVSQDEMNIDEYNSQLEENQSSESEIESKISDDQTSQESDGDASMQAWINSGESGIPPSYNYNSPQEQDTSNLEDQQDSLKNQDEQIQNEIDDASNDEMQQQNAENQNIQNSCLDRLNNLQQEMQDVPLACPSGFISVGTICQPNPSYVLPPVVKVNPASNTTKMNSTNVIASTATPTIFVMAPVSSTSSKSILSSTTSPTKIFWQNIVNFFKHLVGAK